MLILFSYQFGVTTISVLVRVDTTMIACLRFRPTLMSLKCHYAFPFAVNDPIFNLFLTALDVDFLL